MKISSNKMIYNKAIGPNSKYKNIGGKHFFLEISVLMLYFEFSHSSSGFNCLQDKRAEI